MSGSSLKEVFCYVHFGGQFVKDVQGRIQYEGGKTNAELLREGMTQHELLRMISLTTGNECNGVEVKYTVKFDYSTFIDLVNNEGVQKLVRFNDEFAYVYIGENRINEIVETSMEHLEGIEAIIGFSLDDSPCWEEGNTCGEDGNPSWEEVNTLPCGTQSLPTPRPMLNCTKWKDLFLGVGQTFPKAKTFRKVMYKYSVAHKFGYKYVNNSRKKIIAKCMVVGCQWKITAYVVGRESPFLCVHHFHNQHTHSAQDYLLVPRRVNSTLVACIIDDALMGNPNKTATEIVRDLLRDYGLILTYKQAYRAREKALGEIHGRPDKSYMLIPWLCDRLMETDPDTIAKWEASGDNKFQRLFIAYGCCINGFLLGARPILSIDGSHLSGPYKGTLLSASSYDANDDLFPLAYAIVGGETYDNWAWFLQNLREITGSVQITILSDRHNAIISAMRDIFGSDRHAYCYRHVKENFSSEFMKITTGSRRRKKKDDALKLLDAVAYARLECDFDKAMDNLRCFSPEVTQWLERNGDIDRWALSRFRHRRWDHITTNLAESFNAWLVKERKHNIYALINKHRSKLAKKLYSSKMAMSKWTNGVSLKVEEQLQENVARAETMVAEHYSLSMISVRTVSADLRVNLITRECTCQAWQMVGIPCPHACAAIRLVHGNVYAYVEDCYKISAQEKIYSSTMIPLETNDMPWLDELTSSDYESHTFLQPPITTRAPGRPRTRRWESQFQNKKVYMCSFCHQLGHNRCSCKNPNPM